MTLPLGAALAAWFALAAPAATLYQTHFPPEEFAARRARVYDAIGPKALAVLQGAPPVQGFQRFRQTNEVYYLCGIETPGAYLLLDSRTRRTTFYLPHRDEARERNEGRSLTAEDAAEVKQLTGVDEVAGVEALARVLAMSALRPPGPALYTLLTPAERGSDSRDEILGGLAGQANDPWDGRPSREGQFAGLLRARFPQVEIRDLAPILDTMRIVKSAREIELIRRASRIAGHAILEAMRSTRPGVMEYQIAAAAQYIFQINGAQGEAYRSITAGGRNAWMGHYWRNDSPLADGDLVLMDYAPDYGYYTSDVTRMWPVNGRYSAGQRELYGFIGRYRTALLKRIRPGVTPDEILDGAAAEMKDDLAKAVFSKPEYRKAAEAALRFRGHLSHPVGLAVHDVGSYRGGPLQPGHVFSIDPMLWVPEEELYVRMEDVVVVTSTGVENFTDFLPSEADATEKIVGRDGILAKRPPER